MTAKYKYSQSASPEKTPKLGNILEQCFLEAGLSPDYFQRIGLENLRFLEKNDEVIGGLMVVPMAQWWGGELVPMTGISAVGITPECRGDGAAIALMKNLIQELYEKQVPLSVLYAATQIPYRKVGYEQAGSACRWEIKTATLKIEKPSLPIKAMPVDSEIFHDLYKKQARQNNGNLNRHPTLWAPGLYPKEGEVMYAYLIGTLEKPQGYVIFSQHRGDEVYIRLEDWVVLTAQAAQSLWAFLASHRSIIDKVHWKGSLADAFTLLFPEKTFECKSTSRWMLRVVDMVKALEMRGYPKEVDRELHLEVKDDLISENNGKYILTVANGRGNITQGGNGELKIDIKALAPLYTGLFSAYQLQVMGKLEAKETALLSASEIFSGLSPWMQDFF
jgi:predicted acetyltransferase